jgi:Domain of unknown function (DUF4279)
MQRKVLNEGYVYFGLRGDDFDPAEVSSVVGIKATGGKRKAHPVPKISYWRYGTERKKAELIDVFELSSRLVKDLTPHIEGILKAKKEFRLEAVLEVVLTISPDKSIPMPSIGFEKDVIDFLHNVGATIDVDTYRATRHEG